MNLPHNYNKKTDLCIGSRLPSNHYQNITKHYANLTHYQQAHALFTPASTIFLLKHCRSNCCNPYLKKPGFCA